MSGISVSLRGEREARKLLDSLSGRELQNRTRRGTRAGAAIFRKDIRQKAGSNGIPSRFKKTATKGHRNPVGTSVGPKSPLHNIFEGGAGSHTIAPGKQTLQGRRLLLSGPAGQNGRKRDFLASLPVTHPGISARPLTTPIFEADKDDVAEKAMDVILEGLR